MLWYEEFCFRVPARSAGHATVTAFSVALMVLFSATAQLHAQSEESSLRAAVEQYNRAFLGKDLAVLKALLDPDIVLYEHSVRNIGLEDVWENHLRPEVEAFQDLRGEFSDLRVWVSQGLGLVTRQYSIQAVMQGRPIDARGNETMAWVHRDGEWKVVHIHYSHPCPRPSGNGS